ncbi:2-hydroxyacyl-CoA dehydratase [Bacillaceae bacterium Marseille-Q3522]|nr:2-hydroxyacyl-CoA dehydratase [Bacillaceae bacterium Marseille-Q3522]
MKLQVGLDVGSTTAKIVALNEENQIVFKSYLRHFSAIKQTSLRLLQSLSEHFPAADLRINASGSSGMSLSEQLGIPFVQEVVACTEAVKTTNPNIDVVIELGGEDAKIIYLTNGMEQRMNNACAGGTGAFIDQIASLLHTDAAGLNTLAVNAEKIYPIASRCGVFAKTDIQPLLNEGARKEDIAASVFQAVVNQTLSGLACGRPIRGNVAFLGGPLTFLPQLRYRFMETLKLTNEHVMETDDGQYFVALGAALESGRNEQIDIQILIHMVTELNQAKQMKKTGRLEPLFAGKSAIDAFEQRHNRAKVARMPLADYEGNGFLGIDAGSTTTKMVLIGENDEILFSFYENNKGNPIATVREGLQKLYAEKPERIKIVRSMVTGYGEKLIQAAFQLDEGEIETVAHYKAAQKFQPDVDFIIDIGGQDMKCIKLKDKVIDRIMLNEACSAGCGSFLANFADTLGLTVKEFASIALTADAPVDLGSRCTVFMNSKVKQVQKEGASIAEISAGLAYSVVSNALYKVMKLKNVEEMGKHIVVQGGTFLNNAVLRAFEKLTGREVIRPDLSGLMGAYGCALLAKERNIPGETSSLLTEEKIGSFEVKISRSRCRRCENCCPLTINRFPDRRVFISGNRCERGAGKVKKQITVANLMQEKLEYLFNRACLSEKNAERGTIGIPRVLNMYENYPFWHRFFTELKFAVVLSEPSNKEDYEKGMETIPSEAVCYPAKHVHGHMMNLIEKKVAAIFYPCVVFEKKEDSDQDNHYNCPVVASYPEVIRVNIEPFAKKQVPFIQPFLSLDHFSSLTKQLHASFPDIPLRELKLALQKAKQEDEKFHAWIRKRGEDVIAELNRTGEKGIVIAGHPYHLDPAVHHGIPDEVAKMDLAVLTEDSICHLAENGLSQQVVNQWTYHSRLYRAAEVVKENENLELLQITSFGCGLDAITTDAVQEILENSQKLYTWIKMDEISNLGAVRIRLRSLKAAIAERENRKITGYRRQQITDAPVFRKQDKASYTILAPQMAPTHFALFEEAFKLHGYRLKVLTDIRENQVEEGLKYVNNDACFPAIVTIGQLVHALKSGDYDVNRTAVVMSQTGGGCRATNYIALLKKALANAGLANIPVLSLNNSSQLEKQPGFHIGASLAKKLVIAACLGDLLLRLKLAVRPYELEKGITETLYQKCLTQSAKILGNFSMKRYKALIAQIIAEFKQIEISNMKKPKIGIVGEILVKFHPYANNQLIEMIEAEGGEAVVPDFIDFFLYGLYNRSFKRDHLGKEKWSAVTGELAVQFIEHYRSPIREALQESSRFAAPLYISKIAKMAEKMLSIGNQMGEGWLLPGEMAELIATGVHNVICVQPFACLPNHILGRGMFQAVKKQYPAANLVSIDYDAGSSKVNQLNRIKLMINISKNSLEKDRVEV